MKPLEPGEMLQWYRIERVLGRGGFGITYLATDTNLDHLVAVKEYGSELQVTRATDQSLDPVTADDESNYRVGLKRFITEARTLVKFNHTNIVRILTVFEANNTAYLVMEFEEGEVFNTYVNSNAPLQESRLKDIFLKIIDGLTQVHDRGFLHRDIKPSNLIIRKNGDPVLLDFGCARPALLPSAVTHTAFVTPGYSPLEQFHSVPGLEEGPWTDIYALSATLHYAITQSTPPNSASRLTALSANLPDPLPAAIDAGAAIYSRGFLQAIDWGLQPNIADRPVSLQQWREALTAQVAPEDNDATVMYNPASHAAATATVLRNRIPERNPASRTPIPKSRDSVSPVASTVMTDRSSREQPRHPRRDDTIDSRFIDEAPWEDIQVAPTHQPPPKKKSSAVPAIAAVTVLLAGSAAAYYLLGSKGESEDQQVADTSTVVDTTVAEPAVAETTNAETTNAEQVSDDGFEDQLALINSKIQSMDLAGAERLLAESQLPVEQKQLIEARLASARQDQSLIENAEAALQQENPDDATDLLASVSVNSPLHDKAAELRVAAVQLRDKQLQLAQQLEQQKSDLQTEQKNAAVESRQKIEQALYDSDFQSAKSLIANARQYSANDDQLAMLIARASALDSFGGKLDELNLAIENQEYSNASTLVSEARGYEIRNQQLDSLIEQLARQEGASGLAQDAIASGNTAFSSRQWESAVTDFRKALEYSPDNPDAKSGIAASSSYWLESIETEIDNDQVSSAQSSLASYTRLFGSTAEAQRLQQELGQVQSAGQDIQRAEQQIANGEGQAALALLSSLTGSDKQNIRIKQLTGQAQAMARQQQSAQQDKLAEEAEQQRQQALAREQQKAERQRQEQLALELQEAERKEKERLALTEQEAERKRLEQEALERQETQRKAEETIALEQQEAKRKQQETLALEKQEAERKQREQLALQQQEADRKQQEKLALEEKQAQEDLKRQAEAEALQQETLRQAKQDEFNSQLASATSYLNGGDLRAASAAIEAARRTGLSDNRFASLITRYNELLAASQAKPELDAQAIREAESMFLQLAKAVMNRNEKAVGILTEGGEDKRQLMSSLFDRYKQIEVEIKDLVPGADNTVSAVLQLQSMSRPDGSTAFPSDQWRDHKLKVEYSASGWSRIRW